MNWQLVIIRENGKRGVSEHSTKTAARGSLERLRIRYETTTYRYPDETSNPVAYEIKRLGKNGSARRPALICPGDLAKVTESGIF